MLQNPQDISEADRPEATPTHEDKTLNHRKRPKPEKKQPHHSNHKQPPPASSPNDPPPSDSAIPSTSGWVQSPVSSPSPKYLISLNNSIELNSSPAVPAEGIPSPRTKLDSLLEELNEEEETSPSFIKKAEKIPSWKKAMEQKKNLLKEKQKLTQSYEDSPDMNSLLIEPLSERGTLATTSDQPPETPNTSTATTPNTGIPIWRERLLQKKQALKDMKQKGITMPSKTPPQQSPLPPQLQQSIPSIIMEECSDNVSPFKIESVESPTRNNHPEEMIKKQTEEIKKPEKIKKQTEEIKKPDKIKKQTEEFIKREDIIKKPEDIIKKQTEEFIKNEEIKKPTTTENIKKPEEIIKREEKPTTTTTQPTTPQQQQQQKKNK